MKLSALSILGVMHHKIKPAIWKTPALKPARVYVLAGTLSAAIVTPQTKCTPPKFFVRAQQPEQVQRSEFLIPHVRHTPSARPHHTMGSNPKPAKRAWILRDLRYAHRQWLAW